MNNKSDRILYLIVTILFILSVFISIYIFFPSVFENVKVGNFFYKKSEEELLTRIEFYISMQNYDKSIDAIAEFISKYPESKKINSVYINAAHILYEKGRYNDSLKYINELLVKNNLNNIEKSNIAIIIGKIMRDCGLTDPIYLSFLESVYMYANSQIKSELAIYIGYVYLYRKDFANANVYFNNATGEYAYIGKIRNYIEQGMYPEAINEYHNYFYLYPRGERREIMKNAYFKQTLFYIEYLLNSNFYEKAEEYTLKLVNLFPNEDYADIAYITLANYLIKSKKYDKAEFYLKKIMRNNPKNKDEEANYLLSTVYYAIGDRNKALNSFYQYRENYKNGKYIEKVNEWIELIKKEILN